MPGIKLGRLPDRTPVKLAITITPELHHALQTYAAAYEHAYGVAESVIELVPAILAAFLDGDKVFAKRRRGEAPDAK